VGRFDPELTFMIGPVNGRKARESCLYRGLLKHENA
jgi:hypothetical protein